MMILSKQSNVILVLILVLVDSFRTTATAVISEEQIRNQCWSVVKVLPVYNTEDQFKEWLHSQCVSRYFQLIEQGRINNEILINGYRNGLQSCTSIEKKKLFVLDFDETIVDARDVNRNRILIRHSQRKVIDKLYIEIADKYNSENLTFGLKETPINQSHQRDPEYLDLMVFRPYFLDFIHKFNDESQFIIYSLADARHVFPQVILLEMYYNLVFRLHQNRKSRNLFKFRRVITYLVDDQDIGINTKSFSTVNVIMGNLENWDSIYIVDDAGCNVWCDGTDGYHIPVMASYRIYALRPAEFRLRIDCTEWKTLVEKAKEMQIADRYFLELMLFVDLSDLSHGFPYGAPAVQENGIFHWIDHKEMLRIILGILNGSHVSTAIDNRDYDRKKSTSFNCYRCIVA